MKIHPLTEAIALSRTWLQHSQSSHFEKAKTSEGERLDMRSPGWSEGSELIKSLNQANGMTSLHGLVVHGAACASLLALGSMAAVGRESSYELVMASVNSVEPAAQFIGSWPTAESQLKSTQQGKVSEPDEESHSAAAATFSDEQILHTLDIEQDISRGIQIDEHAIDNADDFTAGTLTNQAESEPMLTKSDIIFPTAPAVSFSYEMVNPQQEFGVLRDDRPRFAGQAQPGSLIELVNQDGEILGTSQADARGYWHVTPSTPLANGEYQLSLYTTDTSGVRAVAAPSIHLVIAVEPPTLHTVIEAIEAPTLSVLPMLESEPGLDLTLILPVEVQPVHGNFAFGLSDLLPTSEPELLFAESFDDAFSTFDESALQQLIHPEGGITLWEQHEDLALLGLEYSPSATIGSSDLLFADLMSNHDY